MQKIHFRGAALARTCDTLVYRRLQITSIPSGDNARRAQRKIK